MTLVRFEARKLISDRVYILFLLLPVILAAFFAVVWPVAESLTASRLDFDLTPYRSWLGVTPWVWPALLLTVELPAGALPTPLLLYLIALLVHAAWIVLLIRSELRAVRQGRR